jgi:signal transduction histidine kinase
MQDMPFRRKLMTIILTTTAVVMALMSGAFVTYEVVTIRKSLARQMQTLGEMLAANSTAALAFQNQDDATEILSALSADKHVISAALYDKSGHVFARYPAAVTDASLPAAPGETGYVFNQGRLTSFSPVIQAKSDRLGTLYLAYDSGAIVSEWMRASLGIGAVVLAIVLAFAYLLSRHLQQQISHPILALADMARDISTRRDYSVRAPELGKDEVGTLTTAFNEMLTQLQDLTRSLEEKVAKRTAELEAANVELRRSEAEVNNLFESLPGLYVVLTPDLVIKAASDAYLRATNVSREAIVGRRIFDVFPDNPADSDATGETNVGASLEKVLRTGETNVMAIQRYDIRGTDGTYRERYWSPVNSPVLDAERKVRYIIHRVEEVTDFVLRKAEKGAAGEELRIKMENIEAEIYRSSQQVQAANRQLEAANRELEAFSYSVSHDLRAPLRHVDGFAAMLAKHVGSSLDERGKHLLGTISSASKKMGRLIDDLLSFSRTGRTEMKIGPVDQDAVVASVIAEGQFDTAEKKIAWKIARLPAIRADAAMMRQVWANLIQNAVKYSGKNDAPFVEIGCQPGPEREVAFFVKDNGVGFDMKYVDKLFGVFQRLHSSNEFEGTGIGLANIRRIVARHGGQTWAEGVLGQGATFFFSLPPTLVDGQAPRTT